MKHLNSPFLTLLMLAGFIALAWYSQREEAYASREEFGALLERVEEERAAHAAGASQVAAIVYLYGDDGEGF